MFLAVLAIVVLKPRFTSVHISFFSTNEIISISVADPENLLGGGDGVGVQIILTTSNIYIRLDLPLDSSLHYFKL